MSGFSDARLAALAAAQGGPVSRGQARAAGLSLDQVAWRLEHGRWHEVHDGVYAVGHRAMTSKGFLMAAVLAGGPGAVASHWSAAWWHGLLQHNRTHHDVTTRRHREARRITFHRCKLTDADVTSHEGAPVTTVARTLLDLAELAPRRVVERALDQAEVHGTLDLDALSDVIRRSRGRRGLKRLRAVLATHVAGSTITRSELEERFLRLVDDAGLPRPHVNAHIDDLEVDFHWPQRNLVVEVDGHAFHRTRKAAAADRRRDRKLRAAGIDRMRFGWEEIVGAPADVLAELTR